VGSGGTLTGLSNFFTKVDPHVEMILADPVGSVLANHVEGKPLGQAGSWLVEGIGEDFIPAIADLSKVHKAYRVSDADSFRTARELLNKEGVLAGSTSGTLLCAALRFCKEQTTPKRVVCLIPDTGSKYLSKMYSDVWLGDQGLMGRNKAGDLTDLISRRYQEGRVVTVAPNDAVRVAYARMRMYDVSQLPVIEEGKVVGFVDESNILLGVLGGEGDVFSKKVADLMDRNVATFPPTAAITDLLPVLNMGHIPIIVQGDQFLGLITKIDVVNYLRLQHSTMTS
jgi:cystathionine beta-synthase